jgi:hypothetical protein
MVSLTLESCAWHDVEIPMVTNNQWRGSLVLSMNTGLMTEALKSEVKLSSHLVVTWCLNLSQTAGSKLHQRFRPCGFRVMFTWLLHLLRLTWAWRKPGWCRTRTRYPKLLFQRENALASFWVQRTHKDPLRHFRIEIKPSASGLCWDTKTKTLSCVAKITSKPSALETQCHDIETV